ncbi:STAS domain-containing protein [Thermococcus atlanticus]
MCEKIDLGREFSPVLSSRELVRELEKRVGGKRVILDFKNVEFISHSFAHELLMYKLRNQNIELVNINPSVAKMLEVVEQHLKRGQTHPRVKVIRKSILSIIT